MDDREPTIRGRELGEGLRAAMGRANLTGKQVAHQLLWSPGRVSRLLSGKRGSSELDVVSVLAICRVTGCEHERLLKLCRDADTPGWLQKHGARLPKQLLTLIDHEDKAVAIHIFQGTAIDGLLQTAEYARALMEETGNAPTDEIDDRVAARLARQGLLSRRPLVRFTFFIHEFATAPTVAIASRSARGAPPCSSGTPRTPPAAASPSPTPAGALSWDSLPPGEGGSCPSEWGTRRLGGGGGHAFG